jgi:endonuclease III
VSATKRLPRERRIVEVLRTLARETRKGRYQHAPVYAGPFSHRASPFMELVSCLVSQRVRDEQTTRVCAKIFAEATTPEELRALPLPRLERMLYGAGFYRQKARTLHALSDAIVEQGGVPQTREELEALPGIGPKCANLILAHCFGQPTIAVDTHVHRISNRLDWVRSKTPEKTEKTLTPLVPVRWRARVNILLVAHGQLVCRPIGPKCDTCAVADLCPRRGVR